MSFYDLSIDILKIMAKKSNMFEQIMIYRCDRNPNEISHINSIIKNKRDKIIKYLTVILVKSMLKNNIITIEWIKNYKGNIFFEACSNGHLELASWLVHDLQMTEEEMKIDNNYIFRQARINRHLSLARWLAQASNMSRHEMKNNDNFSYLFASAHSNNNFKLVRRIKPLNDFHL